MTAGNDVLWRPTAEWTENCQFRGFAAWLRERGLATATDVVDYSALWRWSLADLDRFWRALAAWAGIGIATPTTVSAVPESMPGGSWFPGTTLNYAGVALSAARTGEALVVLAEDGTRTVLTWQELRRQVGALSAWLRERGVRHGDRVVAVLPNRAEAVIGVLAAASVGAVWSVVAPEFGSTAIVSRLRQLEPTVLLAMARYDHGGKRIDRSGVLAEVVAELPSLRDVVWVTPPACEVTTTAAVSAWSDVTAGDAEWVADELPFDHPLWVLFSSGTTGVPKGIVHGHGAVVLEHIKTLRLHNDLRPADRFLVVGTTSWVVWNMLVSGLLVGCTIVLLDGNPAHPDIGRAWRVAEAESVAVLGLGAAHVHAGMRADPSPVKGLDLSALRVVTVTGSPLSSDGYRWFYREVGEKWLASVSGGTDIAGIFLGGAPTEPVRLGRLQQPALGVAAAAWDDAGRPVLDTPGELVITRPMPSMPLYFWNDPDGSRYREAYFSQYPGVWRHGDLVEFAADSTSVVIGRSDSTLNRNGIRMGPADLYTVVESLPDVREALVVGVEEEGGYYLPLYVALHEGADRDPERVTKMVSTAIRTALSGRYVPDDVIVVSAIPHTRTGKKLEVPVKRLLQGLRLEDVVDPGAVDDMWALIEIRDIGRRRSDV
ncbi:acetoacetate--CoA ligase [Streptomyces griseorubiginosus]|uniref:acetoacetate--CoA ligase n=1 Tax=Streptomyces griseorubiginosus TaxID=67304 RepID=UPI00113FE98D|nr:acetoacetate--CoA ligase [Streptomyces griseorubiginosus]